MKSDDIDGPHSQHLKPLLLLRLSILKDAWIAVRGKKADLPRWQLIDKPLGNFQVSGVSQIVIG